MILWSILKASRGLQIGVLILGLWGAFEANNALQRHLGRVEGRSSVIAETNDQAEAIRAKAMLARDRASDVPDAVARMRATYCTDCGN